MSMEFFPQRGLPGSALFYFRIPVELLTIVSCVGEATFEMMPIQFAVGYDLRVCLRCFYWNCIYFIAALSLLLAISVLSVGFQFCFG